MTKKTMDTLIIGENIYEVVDEAARIDIEELKQRANTSETDIDNLTQRLDVTEEDLNKVKLATITPDTSLSIEGAAADAKAVGDAIKTQITNYNELSERVDNITPENIGAVNINNVVNNRTTVEEGYVLDARQAYELHLLIQKRATTATYTALFPSSGWSSSIPYTQTVNVEGILATDNPIVDIDMSNAMSEEDSALATEEWNLVRRIATNDGSVTMYCYDEIPTMDINIILKVVR